MCIVLAGDRLEQTKLGESVEARGLAHVAERDDAVDVREYLAKLGGQWGRLAGEMWASAIRPKLRPESASGCGVAPILEDPFSKRGLPI
jgi:hypothetical protein